jgi:hypothetical protein
MKSASNSPILIIALLIFMGGMGWFYYSSNPEAFSIGRKIDLYKPVTMTEGQSIRVKQTGLEITVLGFSNEPCQGVCFESGVGVTFQYKYKGETKSGRNLVKSFGHYIYIIDTDNENYVKFEVELI